MEDGGGDGDGGGGGGDINIHNSPLQSAALLWIC